MSRETVVLWTAGVAACLLAGVGLYRTTLNGAGEGAEASSVAGMKRSDGDPLGKETADPLGKETADPLGKDTADPLGKDTADPLKKKDALGDPFPR